MGPTREKKPSKRSLKALQQHSDIATKLDSSQVPPFSSSPTTSILSPTDLTTTSDQLVVPKPSAKSSRSSLRTDRSTNSTTSNFLSSACSTTEAYDPSLIEVILTPDRGYAVYTTSRVPAGTLILAERPIIRLTATEEASSSISVEEALAQHFSALPKSSQKAYLKLHDSQKASFSRIKSIYFSNCYDLGKADTGSRHGGSAIGLLASRINHSCILNVQFSFADVIPSHLANSVKEVNADTDPDHNEGLMLFYTLRNLPAGRELLANYDSIFMSTEQRQVKQQMYYGFQCNCEACTGMTDFWSKSDERRKEMSKLKAQIDKAEKSWTKQCGQASNRNRHPIDNMNATSGESIREDETVIEPGRIMVATNQDEIVRSVIPALERLATLLLKESISGADLVRVYQALSTWSLRAYQEIEARHWQEKEYEMCVVVFGKEGCRTVEVDKQRTK